jgi:hypothetical protein
MPLVSKPNTFSAGTTAVASQVNANEDALYNAINGNLDNDNIKASAGIVDSKLATIATGGKVNVTALSGTVTNAISTTNLIADTITTTNISATIIRATTIETESWIEFGATTTNVGWSPVSNSLVNYKRVGDIVFVSYYIDGTSNANTTSFTLPYTASNLYNVYLTLGRTDDDSVTLTTPGGIVITAGTGVVNCYRNTALATWKNSGVKTISGQFWYLKA